MRQLKNEIIKIIKENIGFIATFLILLFICTFELPFYIEKTGGIIDISDRIKTEEKFEFSGSFNMAYVSSLKATLPTLLIAKLNDNWDIVKIEEQLGNETEEEMLFRNKTSLNESRENAIYVAYKEANKSINITDTKIYVTYVYDEAKTDIEVGDELIEINGIKIVDKLSLNNYINSLQKNEKVTFNVINDDKKYNRTANIIEIEDFKIIGLMVAEDKQYELDPEIEINFKESESGPSGGLMMTIAIYGQITQQDLTNGKKIVGTGTIDSNGNVGAIDGVKYKLAGAVKNKADIFLVPSDNYEEANNYKIDNNYDIELVSVSNFNEAIEYLKN